MSEPRDNGKKTTRRRFFRGLAYAGAGTGLTLAGVGFVAVAEKQWLKLRRVEIPASASTAGLEGMKIALLSDFHLYPHTTLELVNEAIEMSNQLNPDLVLLLGDYVLRTPDSIFDLSQALQKLKTRLGVFAILGNHDHWKGADIVSRGIEQSGAKLLQNQSLTLSWNSQRFVLAGVDDGWVGRQDLKQTLDGVPPELPTLVMMHEPDFADEFSRDERVDIQFSGHSHGGQVRFPLIGSPFLPPYGRKYDQGRYRVGDMWLYTSVGIGVTVPIRFNCPPEVTEVTIAEG